MGIEAKLLKLTKEKEAENSGGNPEKTPTEKLQDFQEFSTRVSKLKMIRESLLASWQHDQGMMAPEYQEKVQLNLGRDEWAVKRAFKNNQENFEALGIKSVEDLATNENFQDEKEVGQLNESRAAQEGLGEADDKMIETLAELGVPVDDIKPGDYQAVRMRIDRFLYDEIQKRELSLADEIIIDNETNGLRNYALDSGHKAAEYVALLKDVKPDLRKGELVKGFVRKKEINVDAAKEALNKKDHFLVDNDITLDTKVIFDRQGLRFPDLQAELQEKEPYANALGRRIDNLKEDIEKKEKELGEKGKMAQAFAGKLKGEIAKGKEELEKLQKEHFQLGNDVMALKQVKDLRLSSAQPFSFEGTWGDFLKTFSAKQEEVLNNNKITPDEELILNLSKLR